ncbi:MAG TPA: ABC transporter permease [Gammaproteobacteria bacterium]|nr:ABC transporter permease [Gammaproteobacteria bacterium]
MADTRPEAQWTLEDDSCVRLSGDWTLLVSGARRRRLKRELHELDSPRRYAWNLCDISAFDSGGALLLWRLWGGSLPDKLDCRDSQRHWFERLKESETPKAPKPSRLVSAVDHLAARTMAILHTVGGLLLLIGQLMVDLAWCIRHPRLMPWKEISATIYRSGASSMLLLGLIGFMIGVVMAIQIGITLQKFGAGEMIVSLMGLAVLRELGSVIAAIILAGRSGSAMTAGIGAMHITEEFNALRAFGASPTMRLVLPRVIGMAISMPLLVVWTDFTGLIGAAITGDLMLNVDWQLFLARLPNVVPIVNFWIGLGKGVVFGIMIALISSYFGISAKPNTESLSRNTTLSVVTSLSLILLFDVVSGAALTNVGL